MQFQRMSIKRFQIPPVRKTLLQRKRLLDLLSECIEYPVTVVKAGAGFGKTTAVSSYAMQETLPVLWFTLTEEERDPATFVSRFIEATLPADISPQEVEPVLTTIHHPLTWSTSARYLARLLGNYFNGETILILDDFHIVERDSVILDWIDTCLQQLPYQIHVILVSRTQPPLKYLQSLETRGEIMWVRERDLEFTAQEIEELFGRDTSGVKARLAPGELTWLKERTGGVAIALSMLWRVWREQHGFEALQVVLDHENALQEHLGRLLCSGMSDDEFSFFVGTSILPALWPEVCDFVLQREDSAAVLHESHRNGLLSLDEKSTTYTLHPLLREYFQQEMSSAERYKSVRRVVEWFYAHGQTSRAIGYLYALEDEALIVPELLEHIPDFLQAGQLSTVDGWLKRLSVKTIQGNAGLLYAKGEIYRYQNQYPAAIKHYESARDTAKAIDDSVMHILSLMGLARLYLDTIQPSVAEAYIREAALVQRANSSVSTDLRLQIIVLCYENAINSGKLVRAQRLQKTLESLGYQPVLRDNSDARLLLRTGQHQLAIKVLKSRVAGEDDSQRAPLSHREATLILSLLHVMMGDDVAAKRLALRGTQVGDVLEAPFVRAVGFIRLGHAEQLSNPVSDEALQSYERAIQFMDEMSVVRGKAEAFMGLCLVHAYRGQFESAREAAERGIAIARSVKDRWMENLVRLAFGQACVVCGYFSEGAEALTAAETDFIQCRDPFLQLCSILWRSLAFDGLHDDRKFSELSKALALASTGDYTFVFTQPTYFGLRDIQMLTPLLASLRVKDKVNDVAVRILHRNGGDTLEQHPGYTLRVQTLGGFRVWKGFTEVTRRDWQREKARQLFQFMVTRRGTALHREEIAAELWGIEDPQIAERDFKVALNVLSAAIEPKKQGRGPSVFIERNGGYYQLIVHPTLKIDRDEFVTLIQQAIKEPKHRRIPSLKRALLRYKGEYLPDTRYEAWSQAERERLNALYIKNALLYMEEVYQSGDFREVIGMGEQITTIDSTCEEAYVWLMRAYGELQLRPQIVQTYRMCQAALLQELGVGVMEATQDLYQNLLYGKASKT